MTETERDQVTLKAALIAARRGGASVSQLAVAHELAEKNKMPETTAELRTHLRNLIPDPNNSRVAIVRTVGLGVMAGILTHAFLRAVSLRTKGAA